MPSPDKLVQLQNVYAVSPGKARVLTTNPSPTRKRQPGTSGLSSLRRPKGVNAPRDSLSPQQWKKWMHEACELNVSSSAFLASTSTESLVHTVEDGFQLVLSPAVARTDERLVRLIEDQAKNNVEATFNKFVAKHPSASSPIEQWRARVTKPRKRRKSTSLRIEPLLSDEVCSHSVVGLLLVSYPNIYC